MTEEEGEDAEQQEGEGVSPDWIDPCLLEDKVDESICALCFGVLARPVSGCPEGHSLCRACYVKVLRRSDSSCPTCRAPVYDEDELVPNRTAENLIAKLRVRCEHAPKQVEERGDPPTAKRAKIAPPTVEALRKVLLQRGCDSTGNKTVLVARLEEEVRTVGWGCRWRGCVGGLATHLGECEWAPVACPNEGCTESPLRRASALHAETCKHRMFKCVRCSEQMTSRTLARHEGSCPQVKVECKNEGCSVKHARAAMNMHRAECQHEEVTCPCPGCDARLLRREVTAHVRALHLHKAAEQLQAKP